MENEEIKLEKEFLEFLQGMAELLAKNSEKKNENEELKESISNFDKVIENLKSIIERKDTFDKEQYKNYIRVFAVRGLRFQQIYEEEVRKVHSVDEVE